MPMTLFASPTSPYARLIRAMAIEKGLDSEIQVQMVDSHTRPEPLTRVTPLSKIPALVREDGSALYDSRVIAAWLDSRWPSAPKAEAADPFLEQTRMAMILGMLDAGILILLETRRPEERQHRPAIDKELARILPALDILEAEAPALEATIPSAATLALGASLAWFDYRLRSFFEWRDGRPALTRLAEAVLQRPSMTRTAPPPL